MKKIISRIIVVAFVFELFVGTVWLEMLTMNAAAGQYEILVHQAWKASHE